MVGKLLYPVGPRRRICVEGVPERFQRVSLVVKYKFIPSTDKRQVRETEPYLVPNVVVSHYGCPEY